MHTPKITATFGDKRLGRKRLLKALSHLQSCFAL